MNVEPNVVEVVVVGCSHLNGASCCEFEESVKLRWQKGEHLKSPKYQFVESLNLKPELRVQLAEVVHCKLRRM